ncbi:MAG: GDSL-type esterase/lipase family protein [Desulfobulbaceae bacterium]
MENILLLGDSLIEYGDWSSLLPEYRIMNRGIAGETAGELAARLGRELDPDSDPRHIIILSGTNDLLMGDATFPAVFETMLPLLRQFCPEAVVAVVGLAPMTVPGLVAARICQANRALSAAALSAGCSFLDPAAEFALHCRPRGNPCFLMDGVHLSPHGYRILANIIRSHLQTSG